MLGRGHRKSLVIGSWHRLYILAFSSSLSRPQCPLQPQELTAEPGASLASLWAGVSGRSTPWLPATLLIKQMAHDGQ